MVRISSTPSIAKQRIYASVAERNRMIVERATSVEKVNPVYPVENNITYSSANHLLSSDLLYDKLEELKRDYLEFYNDERNLHKAIDEIDLDEEIEIEKMKNLLDKYNKAILSLEQFDYLLRTNNLEKILNIVLEYIVPLNDLGIYIVEDSTFEMDEEKYKENLLNTKDDRKSLFRPIRHMLLQLYREFRNIKGPYKEDSDNKYQETLIEDQIGIVLNSKS